MSGLRARFLLTIGALVALLCTSSPGRAERPAAWRGTSLLQLTASREAFGQGAARNWGLSYSIDETYAGPWAYSPATAAASFRADARDASTPERAAGHSTPSGGRPSADGARDAGGLLGRLGPVGLLANIVVPMAMASSGAPSRVVGEGVATRVGIAKMGGGYGLVVAGRFH